jgi:hypothetical protein
MSGTANQARREPPDRDGRLRHTNLYTENTTETTSEITTTKAVVVSQLKTLGISQSAAYRLADRHPLDYILDKVDQTQWLMENKPEAVQNPAGFVRSAIAEDWQIPAQYDYVTRTERVQEDHKRQLVEHCMDCEGSGWQQVGSVLVKCDHTGEKSPLANLPVESG